MQFWKSLEKNWLSGFSFMVLSILMVTTFSQKTFIEKQVFNNVPASVSGPYFYALISGKENHQRISRKLGELPGVALVNILQKEEVNVKVSEILESLGLESGSSLFDFNYAGLKIMFKKGISKRSQGLIRDYLTRLVGKSKVTLGATKENDTLLKKHSEVVGSFKKWGTTLSLTIVFLMWCWSAMSFSKNLKQISYIVESFQRRSNVGMKLYLTGTALVFMFSLNTFLWGSANGLMFVLSVAIISSFTLLFAKGAKWSQV